jgi:uncharacterized protein (DUF4415 family)
MTPWRPKVDGGRKSGFRTRAHIRVAWATPIDPAAKGKPLAIRWPSKAAITARVDADVLDWLKL